MSPDWGNVPAWVGSIPSGGSLLLGFTIMLKDRQERERADARKVSCRIRGERLDLVVRVSNNGNLPIHHVAVGVGARLASGEVKPSGHIPDHGVDIDAGQTNVEILRTSRRTEDYDTSPVPLYVSFTDANGHRWIRNFDGRLTRSHGDP